MSLSFAKLGPVVRMALAPLVPQTDEVLAHIGG